MRSTALRMGDPFSPLHRAAKGFKNETFLVDDTTGEHGDIEGIRKAAAPHLQQALSGIAKGPPVARLFEAYEPKA